MRRLFIILVIFIFFIFAIPIIFTKTNEVSGKAENLLENTNV